MDINREICTGCGQCVIVCPVQAIKLVDKRASIDYEVCVECGVCYRSVECPVNAIRTTRLKWPRIIRSPFSNVIATHKITGIAGRGTEEMKTNDVTDRFNIGEIGFSIELGRPGVGTYLRNIELFTTQLAKIGVEFEPESPVTALLINNQGNIKEEIKNEKVLSTIIEFKVPKNKVRKVLDLIKDIDKRIDTVFSVGIVSRIIESEKVQIINLLKQEGFNVRPNAKVNIGLGRP
ncbi:MAG: 4Fe-4S binding protein [Promethearchaeota archaeon]